MAVEKKVKDPEREKRKFQSAKDMRELMTAYYTEAKVAEVDGSKKIAWITSGGPVEPLHAMDVIPIYPENHSAMLGASKMSVELCEVAEEMGYSRDLCSYFRADIGSAVTKKSPIPGALPKPDFLVASNNICGTVTKWYEVLSRFFEVPLFLIDTPFIHGEVTKQSQRYVEAQMEEYIEFLEENCNQKFDRDRFGEVANMAVKGVALWEDVLATCENKPSPMSCFDAFFFIGPIVTLRGTEKCNEFYKKLVSELKERIENNISAVPNEKIRLLWDNIPIWTRLRDRSELFASHNACLVADTYTNAWARSKINTDDPVKGLANALHNVYLNIDFQQMIEEVKVLVKRFSADGFVIHSNRSCKPYSLGQFDMAKIIQEEMDIPTLIIEADQTDDRVFSEEQTKTRVEAFIETITDKAS